MHIPVEHNNTSTHLDILSCVCVSVYVQYMFEQSTAELLCSAVVRMCMGMFMRSMYVLRKTQQNERKEEGKKEK